MRGVLVALVLLSGTAAADTPTLVFLELDPLPFALGGYGIQPGIRHPALHGVRLGLGNFSLDVPDAITEVGGNDGFEQRVRPGSGALYALYYPSPPGEDGFAFGMSVRLLRLQFRHDEVPDAEARVTEISPEAIVGYQWHPFDNGFYVQPWFALGVSLWRDGEAEVGPYEYAALPVTPFFTVNIGYEHAL